MNKNTKWDVLFIEDDKSEFDLNTKVFTQLFNRVDRALGEEESLRRFNNNLYDMVICDLSVDTEKIELMKQFKEKKPNQTIFVLVDEKDTVKVYGFADLGINAFILSPDQFDEALEKMSQFNPYPEK